MRESPGMPVAGGDPQAAANLCPVPCWTPLALTCFPAPGLSWRYQASGAFGGGGVLGFSSQVLTPSPFAPTKVPLVDPEGSPAYLLVSMVKSAGCRANLFH